MGKHTAPSRRDLRRSTETTTEIPRYVDTTARMPRVVTYPPALCRAAPWVAGVAAVTATASVGFVVAPQINGPDSPTSQTHSVAEILAADSMPDPFDRLAEVAASRAARDAEQEAAVKVQEAAESVAIATRIAQEEEAARKAEAEARAAQEAREAAAAEAAADTAAEEAEEVAEESEHPSAASQTSESVIVPGARLTSGYGQRWGTLHAGIDLAAPLGTPIYTPFGGRVIKAGPSSGFGNAVIIATDEGDEILFGHMRILEVSVGDRVNAGDLITYVGNEGQSTGPHCHVEIRVGGATVNPAPYLRARGVKL